MIENNFNGFEIVGYHSSGFVYFKKDNVIVNINLYYGYIPELINPEAVVKLLEEDLIKDYNRVDHYKDTLGEYQNLLSEHMYISDLEQIQLTLSGDYIYFIEAEGSGSQVYIFGKDDFSEQDKITLLLTGDTFTDNPLKSINRRLLT